MKIKRIAALIVALLLVAVLFAGCNSDSKGVDFVLNEEGTAYTVKIQPKAKKVIIPSVHEGLPVVGIICNSTRPALAVEEVTIPDSITYIDGGAFDKAANLKSVSLPSSVTLIANEAFKGCTSLASITIPDSVFTIGTDAFKDTAWLDSQPDGVVYVGKVAYTYKGTMPTNTTITIKEGTIAIADDAFRDQRKLTEVLFEGEGSLKHIGNHAFYYCTLLKSITIPSSVTHIGNSAFYNCGLETATLLTTSKLVEIGSWAFNDCQSLTAFYFPTTLTIIGELAFMNTGLQAAYIPVAVTSIGRKAFDSSVNIQCEAAAKPADWDAEWCSYGRNITWGK